MLAHEIMSMLSDRANGHTHGRGAPIMHVVTKECKGEFLSHTVEERIGVTRLDS